MARPAHGRVGGMAMLADLRARLADLQPGPDAGQGVPHQPDSRQGYELFRQELPARRRVAEHGPGRTQRRPGDRRPMSRSCTKALSAPQGRDRRGRPGTAAASTDGRVARLALVLGERPAAATAQATSWTTFVTAVDNLGSGLTVSIGDGAARFRDQGVAEQQRPAGGGAARAGGDPDRADPAAASARRAALPARDGRPVLRRLAGDLAA